LLNNEAFEILRIYLNDLGLDSMSKPIFLLFDKNKKEAISMDSFFFNNNTIKRGLI